MFEDFFLERAVFYKTRAEYRKNRGKKLLYQFTFYGQNNRGIKTKEAIVLCD